MGSPFQKEVGVFMLSLHEWIFDKKIEKKKYKNVGRR